MTAHDNFFQHKRAWSKIKDELLSCYLMPYFMKILKTGRDVLYIDGFAGQGKFDDGTKGSPLIAIDIMDAIMDNSHYKRNAGIRGYFIEQGMYVQTLEKNVYDSYEQCKNKCFFEVQVVAGDFNSKVIEIVSSNRNSSVFLYLDPYGYKSLPFSLNIKLAKLELPSFEMLINFNSFGFFRVACKAMKVQICKNDIDKYLMDIGTDEFNMPEYKLTNSLTNVVGGNYWIDIIKKYQRRNIDGYEAEQEITKGYIENLKKYYKFVLNMPIKTKAGNVPKYRMIHVSNHPDGCYLMAKNIQKRHDNLVYNVQCEPVNSLFPEFQTSEQGDIVSDQEIAEKLNDFISLLKNRISITVFIANFVCEYGILCDFKKIYDHLNLLETKDLIKVERVPAVTDSGKKSTFWVESFNKKVWIIPN